MKITRRFRWEAAHRHLRQAPRDLHRHAFLLSIELEGAPNEAAVSEVVERVLHPLLESWRDAVLVAAEDERLQEDIAARGAKHAVLPAGTTAEHLSQYVIDYFCMMASDELRNAGVEAVQVHLEAAADADARAILHKAFARAYLRTDRYGCLKWLTPKAEA